MSIAARTRHQVIRLSSDGGNVVVRPDDEDRFILTAQNAVNACQDHHCSNEAIKRFKLEFVRPLMEWCAKNSHRIQACYVPVPVGYVQVFAVGVSPKYDFELGRDLAKLELELADVGWRVNVLQIPHSEDDELKTYLTQKGRCWFMPNSKQHKAKAEYNRAFLATIVVQDFPDWAAVVAFYIAVHLVERLRTLMSDVVDQHSTTHPDRLEFVQKHHRKVHAEFHELYNASLIARYQTVNSFRTQFTSDDVQKILIDQYLVAIEQYVAAVFAPPPHTGT